MHYKIPIDTKILEGIRGTLIKPEVQVTNSPKKPTSSKKKNGKTKRGKQKRNYNKKSDKEPYILRETETAVVYRTKYGDLELSKECDAAIDTIINVIFGLPTEDNDRNQNTKKGGIDSDTDIGVSRVDSDSRKLGGIIRGDSPSEDSEDAVRNASEAVVESIETPKDEERVANSLKSLNVEPDKTKPDEFFTGIDKVPENLAGYYVALCNSLANAKDPVKFKMIFILNHLESYLEASSPDSNGIIDNLMDNIGLIEYGNPLPPTIYDQVNHVYQIMKNVGS